MASLNDSNTNENDQLLIKAVLSDQPDLAKYAISEGANPKLTNPNGANLFHIVKSGKMVKLLAVEGLDANQSVLPSNRTPLLETKNASVAEELLKAGANTTSRNAQGFTALMNAVTTNTMGDNDKLINVLVKGGAKITDEDISIARKYYTDEMHMDPNKSYGIKKLEELHKKLGQDHTARVDQNKNMVELAAQILKDINLVVEEVKHMGAAISIASNAQSRDRTPS